MSEIPTIDALARPAVPVDNARAVRIIRTRGLARIRNYLALLSCLALVAGFSNRLAVAFAQTPPLSFEVLAAGFSPERHLRIRTTGPSDILQTRIVAQPGGDTGWHTHPGPAVVVVKSGTLTEYHDNGCVSIYQEGSVFFESEGEVHRVVNEGGVASESFATFLIPHGSQPLQPAADPGPRTCQPHGRPGDDGGHD